MKNVIIALTLLLSISCSSIPQPIQAFSGVGIDYRSKVESTLYNYKDERGRLHVFVQDLYKLRMTNTHYFYCYEHQQLEEIVVISGGKPKEDEAAEKPVAN